LNRKFGGGRGRSSELASSPTIGDDETSQRPLLRQKHVWAIQTKLTIANLLISQD